MKKPPESGLFVPDRSQLNDLAREELWVDCKADPSPCLSRDRVPRWGVSPAGGRDPTEVGGPHAKLLLEFPVQEKPHNGPNKTTTDDCGDVANRCLEAKIACQKPLETRKRHEKCGNEKGSTRDPVVHGDPFSTIYLSDRRQGLAVAVGSMPTMLHPHNENASDPFTARVPMQARHMECNTRWHPESSWQYAQAAGS